MIVLELRKGGDAVNSKIPIITKVEFFKASYNKMCAHVAARNFSSLTYRTCGRVLIESEETAFISEADTMTFVPAGHSYSTEIYEPGEILILHYQVAPDSYDFYHVPSLIAPVGRDAFLNLFSEGIRHALAGRECACMADAYRLFSALEQQQNETHPSPRLAAVKQYMDENLEGDLRISALAARHRTSEVYFRQEFKKYYGESPIEYIKKRRIEMACRLLRTELYAISEVATRSGFDSVSYFSSEFRRVMGCSPREYRNM